MSALGRDAVAIERPGTHAKHLTGATKRGLRPLTYLFRPVSHMPMPTVRRQSRE